LTAERKRYVDSEDDGDDDSVVVRPAKRSSRTTSKQKETLVREQRASRSRQITEDEASLSTTADEKDAGRSAGRKTGRLSSSKENHCVSEDKQVLLLFVAKSDNNNNNNNNSSCIALYSPKIQSRWWHQVKTV